MWSLPPPHHGYGAPMPPVGHWEYHQPPGYGSYPHPPRRLNERISGCAKDQPEGSGLPITPGLPAKPIGVDQASSNSTRRGCGNRGNGPLPPPPANAKEDPRASAGKVSYHDMDSVAEGDVELSYRTRIVYDAMAFIIFLPLLISTPLPTSHRR